MNDTGTLAGGDGLVDIRRNKLLPLSFHFSDPTVPRFSDRGTLGVVHSVADPHVTRAPWDAEGLGGVPCESSGV
jgi:hypothetical protein